MKKRYVSIIVVCSLIIAIMFPILLDSIVINFTKKAAFSRTTYWKPKFNVSTMNSELQITGCNCLGQRLYKGLYYEIYHDSDISHYAKPNGLIPVLGTGSKFRFILDEELINGLSYILFGIELI